jgi:hypothetical protein
MWATRHAHGSGQYGTCLTVFRIRLGGGGCLWRMQHFDQIQSLLYFRQFHYKLCQVFGTGSVPVGGAEEQWNTAASEQCSTTFGSAWATASGVQLENVHWTRPASRGAVFGISCQCDGRLQGRRA